ncbi:Na+/H+ antiporter subunit D [Dermatobacter hominis]|uniref:Na+/H+ antiporter subunit D n=1 Tax=Dermatobacter hominis TaxID=2884263 RepID=UPI001D1114DB|nr:Na+/H+ antiporter subunit D [Dermatobacter hominis]UDY35261.1 Na+/H+ antiporter subunit D [Dermatobacter hominis]
MTALIALPILLPLLGAGACIVVGRSKTAQRVISVSVLTVVTALTIVLVVRIDADGTTAIQAGGWPAPLGITLVADRLSSIMLAIASVMLLAVLVYAIGQPGAERNHVGFQSVYLILAAGVSASFLTGDLFTLFVAFEMMLTASYVLITLGARRDQVRAGMTYVVISLLASALLLSALALIYSATGTVNMADLSLRMAELSPTVRSAFALFLLMIFGIKAGLFPLFFWLPDAYPTAPSAVTAIFAGLLTKVGVYAIIRTQTLLFPPESRPQTLILWIAGLTMVVGVLGAIAQADVKRILSFHIVSQIGYMVMGLGLFTLAGLAAAIFYIVHHIVVKTTLFLTGGLIEHVGGSGRLSRVGQLARSAPVVAVLFLVPALSLAGIPPLSGFVAKFGLLAAGSEQSRWWLVAAAVAVSLLTLFSMTKIWAGAFWSPAEGEPEGTPHAVGRLGGPALMVLPTAALAAISLAVALWAGPLYDLSERAATDLLHPAGYVRAVLGDDVPAQAAGR